MKTGSITIFGIIFSISSLFAQSGWFLNYSDTNARFESIFFTDANTGYVVGDKFFPTGFAPIVIKTTNAGGSWSPQNTPISLAPNWMFRGVFFYDANTGYIAGSNLNNADTGAVLKTTNGGTIWEKLTLPALVPMTNVYFPTSLIGYAIGRGKVFKTTNAGNNWTDQTIPVPSGYYLFSLHFINANTGWAVGNSRIICTYNGGINWIPQYTSSSSICGVYFIDVNTGIAVGGTSSSHIILRTSDSGNSWNEIENNSSSALLWSVKFVNANTGWATGWNNNILKTTNGGLNWFNQTPPLLYYNYLRTCFFTSANTGYIVGEAAGPGEIGVIFKTTDGGVTGIDPVSTEIPVNYQLHQNYPNPFNPVTNIKFDLPQGSSVKLAVFDILGREIEVLVNEFLKPGTYRIVWNASDYPSGTYFYKLETNNITETKKMILVK